MALKLRGHAPSCDLIASARLECDEFYRGPEAIKRHRETGRVLLAAERFLEISVTAVNPNPVSRDVRRGKKRKAHDVVPVKMGLKHMEDVGLGGTVPGKYMVSEGAHAAPEIAQHMLIVTRIELHAGGIASESVRNGKVKLRVDPCPRLFLRVETLPRSRDYCMGKLVSDRRGVQRDGNGAARSPERNPQRHRSGAMGGVISRQGGRRNLGQSFANRPKTLEDKVEAADLEDFAHNRLERGYHDRSALLTDFLARQHQDAQPDAANVVDLGKIQDQAISPCAAAGYIGVKPGFQPVGGAVVDSPGTSEHHSVALTLLVTMHGTDKPPDGYMILRRIDKTTR